MRARKKHREIVKRTEKDRRSGGDRRQGQMSHEEYCALHKVPFVPVSEWIVQRFTLRGCRMIAWASSDERFPITEVRALFAPLPGSPQPHCYWSLFQAFPQMPQPEYSKIPKEEALRNFAEGNWHRLYTEEEVFPGMRWPIGVASRPSPTADDLPSLFAEDLP